MPILHIKGLKKAFRGVAAVAGVDLTVEDNQIYSVIGPNGAGKTTLFNLISGYHTCDRGHVYFKGQEITGLPPEKIVGIGIGRSFQVTSIFPGLTVLENIRSTVLVTGKKGFSLFSQASKLGTKDSEETLSLVELLDKRNEPAGVLSAGDRKKLELGIVLATKPKLLLLDEPTCGMSTAETGSTIQMIRKIAQEMSLTVLFTEHKMDMVFNVSSYISVMNFGTIIASGRPEEIRNNQQVQEVYFGGAYAS
ncbi:MAG: ABC transporter ATP-binding protein [Desulfomonile tiedjei]|uniref:ABC transporter ATP-binding protein n=1 Tax=Desulfomonile tiedjei TaxID=2358 RepID=A0A9D6V6P0_9BACT|nr:ABC transporter ATP-binding protein [Desulfomonile tiedjei]